ncbi:hypothetical protein BDM02DRAFT_3092313 [Thelephora ganbajun]|uniref:Uncharacterized protein n=1 Tax=Thelephora ganbajun TaxID=370292 RepID=A0ACB6ZM59_THEGA|nr:hypothetical protein BDM02DRAFT_3092313 [Thelephora ganbajun]
MTNHSEYQPISQSVDDEEADVAEPVPSSSASRPRRSSISKKIDLRKLDNAFKRWTESIAQKMKRKKKTEDLNARKEIWRSVFEPYIPPRTPELTAHSMQTKTLDHRPPMSQAEFDALVQGVREAILDGVHPKMIAKGSSGSYFARSKVDGRVQTVGVFKPKDEEPYGRLNPKTTKWLHRQFKWIIPFGRACLIPNLSYISEAAASLLDRRLEMYIVPRTGLVSLSSQAFFYDWIDRTAFKKGKPLPDKIGSLQYFLNGFTDASDFLRKNPFPGRAIAETYADDPHRHKTKAKRILNVLRICCGRTGDEDDFYDEEHEQDHRLFDVSEGLGNRPFYWTTALQDSFREELEKLVILDYLMLNTDRGLDNFMIKCCDIDHEKAPIDTTNTSRVDAPQMSEIRKSNPAISGVVVPPAAIPSMSALGTKAPGTATPNRRQSHIHIAAIDNSLSFPHEHPRGWRSFTYGWLYLPVSIIGRPFSEGTRNHFLPLLTSKSWWEETSWQLRQLFSLDPDFHPKMFNKQLAVIKGQAWNIVQSLKHEDEGPLELTRRQKVLVWNDEVESTHEMFKPEDEDHHESEDPFEDHEDRPSSPHASISTMPLPTPTARLSFGRPRPQRVISGPSRRSADFLNFTRPVSFSTTYSKVHPGTTGVAVLEQMERLDAVEASLKKLGGGVSGEDNPGNADGEVDVTESSPSASTRNNGPSAHISTPGRISRSSSSHTYTYSNDDGVPPIMTASFSGPFSPGGISDGLPAVVEEAPSSSTSEVGDEDLAHMSKSMSYMDARPSSHSRWMSQDGNRPRLEWIIDEGETPKPKMVVVERVETVNAKPFFSW